LRFYLKSHRLRAGVQTGNAFWQGCFADRLEFSEYFRVVLRHVAKDAGIVEEFRQVAPCKHEVENFVAMGFLDVFQISL